VRYRGEFSAGRNSAQARTGCGGYFCGSSGHMMNVLVLDWT